MKTFADRDVAFSYMTTKNRAYRLAGNYKDLAVLVDGPGENEATVMGLKEAIANDFAYEWGF